LTKSQGSVGKEILSGETVYR